MKSLAELRQRIALAWRIIRNRDGNTVSHAQRELAGSYESGNAMNISMANHLIDMARVFDAEGHSGFSAGYAISALSTLLRFEPLGPLTGDSREWVEVGEQNGKPLYQNNRCGRVFKEGDYAYDIDRVVFREPGGACFTGFHSRVPVKFPYHPKTVYADVPVGASDAQKQAAAQLALQE